jgi:hypothetical protein
VRFALPSFYRINTRFWSPASKLFRLLKNALQTKSKWKTNIAQKKLCFGSAAEYAFPAKLLAQTRSNFPPSILNGINLCTHTKTIEN